MSQELQEQSQRALRQAIVNAMNAGMSQGEIIKVLESAIGVLKSGDMK